MISPPALPLRGFASDHSPPRRILIRGVNWLGDAVLSTPALHRLRERFGEARITLLTHEKLAELWRYHPSIDEVITFPHRAGLWAVAARIRAGQAVADRFDFALVFPNSPRSALEVWLARVPRRIGYARPPRNWGLTQAVPRRPAHSPMHRRSVNEINRLVEPATGRPQPLPRTFPSCAHQIFEYLHLAAALGADPNPVPPGLTVMPEEIEAVISKFGLGAVIRRGAPVFGLIPGAEYGPAKCWPVERFAAAARELGQRTQCAWLMLGGRADTSVTAQVASALLGGKDLVQDLAGRTSLRELCALLKVCGVVLTNDTGPMHVAAALGTPVVVPFGSTSPELTGPGLPGDQRHRVLRAGAPCTPCFRRTCPIDFRCMTGISVASVVDAVLQVAPAWAGKRAL